MQMAPDVVGETPPECDENHCQRDIERPFTECFGRFAQCCQHAVGADDVVVLAVAAERALLEADTSRKRRAEVIDQVAAGYILQGALDRLRFIG